MCVMPNSRLWAFRHWHMFVLDCNNRKENPRLNGIACWSSESTKSGNSFVSVFMVKILVVSSHVIWSNSGFRLFLSQRNDAILMLCWTCWIVKDSKHVENDTWNTYEIIIGFGNSTFALYFMCHYFEWIDHTYFHLCLVPRYAPNHQTIQNEPCWHDDEYVLHFNLLEWARYCPCFITYRAQTGRIHNNCGLYRCILVECPKLEGGNANTHLFHNSLFNLLLFWFRAAFATMAFTTKYYSQHWYIDNAFKLHLSATRLDKVETKSNKGYCISSISSTKDDSRLKAVKRTMGLKQVPSFSFMCTGQTAPFIVSPDMKSLHLFSAELTSAFSLATEKTCASKWCLCVLYVMFLLLCWFALLAYTFK